MRAVKRSEPGGTPQPQMAVSLALQRSAQCEYARAALLLLRRARVGARRAGAVAAAARRRAAAGAGRARRPSAAPVDADDESAAAAPDMNKNASPVDNRQLWLQPYLTPFNTDLFDDNWAAWKAKVYTTYQMRKPDYEYRAQFTPGVGSLRPFVRPARPIPPNELLWALGAGVMGSSMGTTGGLIGFVFSCWLCYATGACGPSAGSYDPTSGSGQKN